MSSSKGKIIRKQTIFRLISATVFWLFFTKSFVFIEERYYNKKRCCDYNIATFLKIFCFEFFIVLGIAAEELFLREDNVLMKALRGGAVSPYLDTVSY